MTATVAPANALIVKGEPLNWGTSMSATGRWSVRWSSAILGVTSLLTASCAEARKGPIDEAMEQYFKAAIFENNPSGKTFSTSINISRLFINDRCLHIGGKSMIALSDKLKIYFESDLAPKSASRYDVYNIDRIFYDLSALPRGITFPPDWLSGKVNLNTDHFFTDPMCDEYFPGELPASRRTAGRFEVYLTNRSFVLESLWARPERVNVIRSRDKQVTPTCYVEIETRPGRNDIIWTKVHAVVSNFKKESLLSKQLQACIVRGAAAAYGMPGVLNWPDDKVLGPEWNALAFPQPFDARMRAAAALFNVEGLTWPEARKRADDVLAGKVVE